MSADKKWYVYMLRCSDGSLYTGIKTDVDRRFKEHRDGSAKGAKYTRVHTPVKLEAVFEASSRSQASSMEYAIKKLAKEDKEELVRFPDKVERIKA